MEALHIGKSIFDVMCKTNKYLYVYITLCMKVLNYNYNCSWFTKTASFHLLFYYEFLQTKIDCNY